MDSSFPQAKISVAVNQQEWSQQNLLDLFHIWIAVMHPLTSKTSSWQSHANLRVRLFAPRRHRSQIYNSQREESSTGEQPRASVDPGLRLRPPNTKRAVIAGVASSAIVLGSNFLGTTSFLLSLDNGELAGKLKLDSLVPVKGYKRCIDYQNGFEFLFPKDWLADQQLYYRYAQRVEQQTALDPPSLSSQRRLQRDYSEPIAAFGPPGSTGETNISVVVAPVRSGFRLQSMGSPDQAATVFLENVVAPPGSDKEAHLIRASSRQDKGGQLYYTMEFTVQSPSFFRHNLAVYGARNDLLYTLNCQCSEAAWTDQETLFTTTAESLSILSSGSGTAEYPNRL